MKPRKVIRTILPFIVLICMVNCTAEENDSNPENDTVPLLKSATYQDWPADAKNYDEFFEYENRLLTKSSGFSRVIGDFSYENDLLTSSYWTSDDGFSTVENRYAYNENDQLIKAVETRTDRFDQQEINTQEFSYLEDKILVLWTRQFVNGTRISRYELITDPQGRLLKSSITERAENETTRPDYTEYVYDEVGNIIEVRTKEYQSDEISTERYDYGNIRNPYFHAFQRYFLSVYYAEFSRGIPVFDDFGISPYLQDLDNKVYEVDSNSFPSRLFSYNPYVDETYEIVFEYY